ncbi:unnamed protein product, partial [Mesorhabditis spiculigera]
MSVPSNVSDQQGANHFPLQEVKKVVDAITEGVISQEKLLGDLTSDGYGFLRADHPLHNTYRLKLATALAPAEDRTDGWFLSLKARRWSVRLYGNQLCKLEKFNLKAVEDCRRFTDYHHLALKNPAGTEKTLEEVLKEIDDANEWPWMFCGCEFKKGRKRKINNVDRISGQNLANPNVPVVGQHHQRNYPGDNLFQGYLPPQPPTVDNMMLPGTSGTVWQGRAQYNIDYDTAPDYGRGSFADYDSGDTDGSVQTGPHQQHQ